MHPKNPSSYPKRILVLAVGTSPQVVTETLYALSQQGTDYEGAFIPTEIYLYTTTSGKKILEEKLLDPETGCYYQLIKDYQLDNIIFDQTHIKVIHTTNGTPLEDIRSPEDNSCAADCIINWLRELTQDTETAVHVSLAGGRKTMSYYTGYAISLLGRPQDRLSHILVSPDGFEHNQFFYPPPIPFEITTRKNEILNTKDAVLTLAKIPFVRLRKYLPEAMCTGKHNFLETVNAVQGNIEEAKLILYTISATIECNGVMLKLSPSEFAMYLVHAEDAKNEKYSVINPEFTERYLKILANYSPPESVKDTRRRIEKKRLLSTPPSESQSYESNRAKIHKKMDKVLGLYGKHYHISIPEKATTIKNKTIEIEQASTATLKILAQNITINTKKDTKGQRKV